MAIPAEAVSGVGEGTFVHILVMVLEQVQRRIQNYYYDRHYHYYCYHHVERLIVHLGIMLNYLSSLKMLNLWKYQLSQLPGLDME